MTPAVQSMLSGLSRGRPTALESVPSGVAGAGSGEGGLDVERSWTWASGAVSGYERSVAAVPSGSDFVFGCPRRGSFEAACQTVDGLRLAGEVHLLDVHCAEEQLSRRLPVVPFFLDRLESCAEVLNLLDKFRVPFVLVDRLGRI